MNNQSQPVSSFDPEVPASPPDIGHPRFDYSPTLLQNLSKWDLALGYLRGADIDGRWLAEVEAEAQILEAHHSTAIEGTQLSLDQAQRLLQGDELPEVSADVRRELLNYRYALARVHEYCASERHISERVICQIHKDIVQGVRGGLAQPGEYRRVQNAIEDSASGRRIFTPQLAETVPQSMADLVAWTNAQLSESESTHHPVVVAGVCQFWFLHIHPFLDGNGRTSRLLSTCILSAAGHEFVRLFALSAYYDKDRTRYYEALQSVRTRGLELTSWLEYFSSGLAVQLDELRQRAQAERQLQQLALKHGLSERQLHLLRFAAQHPQSQIADFQARFPEISRRTLQRDLARLEQAQLIRSLGATNHQMWEVLAIIGVVALVGSLFETQDENQRWW